MKIISFYVVGSIIWLALLSLLSATQDLVMSLLMVYVYMTISFFFGYYGKAFIEKRPWILILFPIIPIIFGFF